MARPLRHPPLGRDVRLLFLTRIVRMVAYGFLFVVLVLYLAGLGFSEGRIGLLLSLTLAGDALVSLGITLHADRVGRRRMFLVGAALMVGAGVPFVLSRSFGVLLVAATLGVVSPSGNEVGPFLALEQAALAQVLPEDRRTAFFAWYHLAGAFATALGALAGGWAAQALQGAGWTPVASYRAVVAAYAAAGCLLALLFLRMGQAIEAPQPAAAGRWGLHGSKGVVLRLSALFSLDAFAGGFVIQSLLAYWLHLRFGVSPGALGSIFFAANLLAGLSSLYAVRLAARIGYVRTMVFTHIPSNVLLILVPLMPSLPVAMAVLLLRFSISQMDVPTRQAYTMAVVAPEERSAAAGITGIARTTGAALSPGLATPLLAVPGLLGVPFFLAGGLKILYDLLLYRSFKAADRGTSAGGEPPRR
jgi:MFS family permease